MAVGSLIMRAVITDIWFVTEIELKELADKLGLINISYDAGGSWQWVSGDLLDFKLDMTRTNFADIKDAQTRVFLFDKDLHFSAGFTDYLAVKLKALGVAPIYFGRWITIKGSQYEQCIEKIIT